MNTENDAWGKRLYKLRRQKFLLVSLFDVIDLSNQLTYSLFIPIRYYDSNDMKFYTLMKI